MTYYVLKMLQLSLLLWVVLVTLVERHSRYIMLVKVKNKETESVEKGF